MFCIELYGIGPNGNPLGPERVTFTGADIEDAIAQAKRLMHINTFFFGKARSFKIYNNDGCLIYVSEARL
jgi:hypothetical protein